LPQKNTKDSKVRSKCEQSYNNLPLIAIAGPTAIGKTEVALAVASRINAEIISCDSMQIYKGFAVGTAKPSKLQMKSVPHHLISTVERGSVFSVAEYLSLAAKKIEKVKEKNKNVVITGGTGLYMKTLFEGIFKGPGRDKKKRDQLKQDAEEKGLDFLYNSLKKKDPEYAGMISQNDERRIIRALEVIDKTDQKFSELQKNKETFINGPYLIFCLTMERGKLYKRIDDRVDKMMEQGLMEEARELYKNKKNKDATLKQAIGYKELFPYFEGSLSLEEAVSLIKRNTRRFAKRQFTWFRKMKDVVWVEAEKPVEDIVSEILSKV